MPKGKKNYTTPDVCIPINNPRRNIPSERDQNAMYRLQQSALDSFHAEMYGPVFLSVGPEAKLDMYNNFNLDKPFDLHLDPPSSKDPPLCRIIQEGKDPILTTDFYLTDHGSFPPIHKIRILLSQVAQQQQISLHQL